MRPYQAQPSQRFADGHRVKKRKRAEPIQETPTQSTTCPGETAQGCNGKGARALSPETPQNMFLEESGRTHDEVRRWRGACSSRLQATLVLPLHLLPGERPPCSRRKAPSSIRMGVCATRMAAKEVSHNPRAIPPTRPFATMPVQRRAPPLGGRGAKTAEGRAQPVVACRQNGHGPVCPPHRTKALYCDTHTHTCVHVTLNKRVLRGMCSSIRSSGAMTHTTSWTLRRIQTLLGAHPKNARPNLTFTCTRA